MKLVLYPLLIIFLAVSCSDGESLNDRNNASGDSDSADSQGDSDDDEPKSCQLAITPAKPKVGEKFEIAISQLPKHAANASIQNQAVPLNKPRLSMNLESD